MGFNMMARARVEKRAFLVGTIGALLACGLSTAAAHATTMAMTPTDMGTLGGTHSTAQAVDGGLVVGQSQISGNAAYRAFAYDLNSPSASMVDLGTLGGTHSNAKAVSGNIVVGFAHTYLDRVAHAFAYDLSATDPTMRDLGTLGGSDSDAVAVSGDIVVGQSNTAQGGLTHAFAYDLGAPDGAMVDLGDLGSNSYATGVSGSNVVGYSYLAGDVARRAFAYDLSAADPTMVDLGTLGGSSSLALGISGNIVVGLAQTPGDVAHHAFAYDLGATNPAMIDLGTLGGNSQATAVSGDLVVGWSNTPSGARHTFVYDLGAPNPAMIDLGTLGGTDSWPVAVDGRILVGRSDMPGGSGIHAFAYDLSASDPWMIDLGTLGGSQSEALAVSGDAVVGFSGTAHDGRHAVTWTLPRQSPPSAPQELAALGRTLSWDPPADDGGSPVTSYLVTRDDGANGEIEIASTPETSLIDTTATAGTRYIYRVRADNGQVGPPASIAHTIADPPDAPTNLYAQPTSPTSAALTWEPPEDNGSPIASYTVYRGTSQETMVSIATTPNPSYTDTGLTKRTKYYWAVKATNAVGEGPVSFAVTATTPILLCIQTLCI